MTCTFPIIPIPTTPDPYLFKIPFKYTFSRWTEIIHSPPWNIMTLPMLPPKITMTYLLRKEYLSTRAPIDLCPMVGENIF